MVCEAQLAVMQIGRDKCPGAYCPVEKMFGKKLSIISSDIWVKNKIKLSTLSIALIHCVSKNNVVSNFCNNFIKYYICFVDNSLLFPQSKNFQNRLTADEIISKVRHLVIFWDTVYINFIRYAGSVRKWNVVVVVVVGPTTSSRREE